MKQLFRWPGLIAFIVITCAGAAFWWLLADTLLKMGVESAGSELVGAEVNLGSADLSLDPLAIRLNHLQVTDPDAPARNALELGEAIASIEPWSLLMGQLIINDLSITGLQLNTPRSRPGALKTRQEASPTSAAEPSVLQKAQASLPPVSEVLGREELLVSSRAAALQSGYAEEQAKVDAAIAALPDAAQRQQFQERYNRATAAKPKTLEEFNRQKQELEQLQKELKGVKDNLEQGRKQVALSKQRLQEQWAALKAAPGEDLRRLSAKYSLSAEGGLNISRLLFGEKVGGWATTALQWYRRIEPFIASGDEVEEQKVQRAEGRYIRFPSKDPLPDFLLRKAQLQATLPFGEVEGVLRDVTHQPAIIGRPATLHAAASQLSGAKAFKLDASFNHVNTASAKDEVTFSLQGLKLEPIALSSRPEFPLTLAQAASDISGKVTLQQGQLDARFDGAFSNARFEGKGGEGLAGEIATALATIDRFNIQGSASGELGAPQVSLSSDLDKRLSEQLNQRLKAKQAEFEQELRAQLQQRIAGPQGEYQEKLAALQNLEAELDQRLAENKKMLEAKVESFKGGASKQLDDKLKGLKF